MQIRAHLSVAEKTKQATYVPACLGRFYTAAHDTPFCLSNCLWIAKCKEKAIETNTCPYYPPKED